MEEKKTSKQLRKENKLRKMAAYVEIAELNAKERQNIAASHSRENPNDFSHSSDPLYSEPSRKKFKSNDEPFDHPAESSQDQADQTNADISKFSEAELAELRKLLKERAKALKKTPLLTLKEPSGFQAELDVPATDRIPLFLQDIQNLALYTVFNKAHTVPRWCHMKGIGGLSAVRILFIEGAGISDYLMAEDKLPALSESFFPFRHEVLMPAAYGGNLVEEFCAIPMPQREYNRLVSMYGTFEKVLQANCGVFKVLRAFFNVNQKSATSDNPDTEKKKEISDDPDVAEKEISDDPEIVNKPDSSEIVPKPTPPVDEENSSDAMKPTDNTMPDEENTTDDMKPTDNTTSKPLPPGDKFPRTSLLLSPWQMIEENYPIPVNAALRSKYKDFVTSKRVYKEVNNFSPMYALDCEMCVTSIGQSECTRVSIINENHETILDTLVLPYNKITNYVTRFSGITKAMMKDVDTRLEDVQRFIQKNIEPDAILVGQSLNFDLVSLKIMHPYCIDTSVIFNLSGNRYRKSKLKYLSDHFLSEKIQQGNEGHSSVEDSIACLKLVQLKLSESLEFGDEVLSNQGRLMADFVPPKPQPKAITPKKLRRPKEKVDTSGYGTSLFSFASRSGKHSAVIALAEVLETYVDYLDARIIKCEEVNQDKDGGLNNSTPENEDSSSGQVSCIVAESNNSVIENIATQGKDNFFSVGHIRLSESESDSLAFGNDETLEMLNSWVSQVQTSAPLNSLSLVVLCGREKSSNGVCFMNLRKPTHQRLNFKPKDSSS